MANAAPSVTRRMAPVAQPTHSLQGFLAFTTICVKPGALLIQLKHWRQPRQFYDLSGDIPQPKPTEYLDVTQKPVLLQRVTQIL